MAHPRWAAVGAFSLLAAGVSVGSAAIAPPSPEAALSEERQQTALHAKDSDRFENVTAGFAITRPSGWHFATLQEVSANRARVRLKDEQLDELVKKRANAPLVAITKYKEPYEALNPSIQVLVRPLGQLKGVQPTKLMEAVIGTLQKAMADFTFVVPIRDASIAGLPGAHMRATYTVENAAGQQFPTVGRMWLVPRGDFLFIVSMSGPPEAKDASDAEFDASLASIEIAP